MCRQAAADIRGPTLIGPQKTIEETNA